MNVIPFFGPWIAFIPALTIGFFQDPILAIWVAVITLIAQQTDSNLITPNVMGKTLNIHPLTIITVLLAAGNIDRKSTRLNSSHVAISYAVFCLKKKKKKQK